MWSDCVSSGEVISRRLVVHYWVAFLSSSCCVSLISSQTTTLASLSVAATSQVAASQAATLATQVVASQSAATSAAQVVASQSATSAIQVVASQAATSAAQVVTSQTAGTVAAQAVSSEAAIVTATVATQANQIVTATAAQIAANQTVTTVAAQVAASSASAYVAASASSSAVTQPTTQVAPSESANVNVAVTYKNTTCDAANREEALNKTIETILANVTGLKNVSVTNRSAECGSIIVTFTLTFVDQTNSSIQSAIAELKAMVQSGNLSITINGSAVTADPASFGVTVEYPPDSPTVAPSATGSTEQSTTTPTSETATQAPASGLSTGAIVGISVGAAVFVIILVVILVYCCYYKKATKSGRVSDSQMPPTGKKSDPNQNGECSAFCFAFRFFGFRVQTVPMNKLSVAAWVTSQPGTRLRNGPRSLPEPACHHGIV